MSSPSLSRQEIERQLERCRREIAEMEAQEPVRPAFLTTLGIEDWRGEMRILQQMAASLDGQ